jgi:hypothetical protein
MLNMKCKELSPLFYKITCFICGNRCGRTRKLSLERLKLTEEQANICCGCLEEDRVEVPYLTKAGYSGEEDIFVPNK